MIENLKDEIWMVHPKYNDYAASSLGRIKSLERDIVYKNGAIHHKEEQLIKPYLEKNGYLRFSITNTNLGINDWPLVHRFVYEAFHQMIIPKDRKNFQVNHKNEDKTDNRIFENLELVSASQNINFGTRNKRSAEAQRNDPKRSKQVGQFGIDGNLIKIWESTCECGRNGFDQGHVAACCRGEYNTKLGNNIYKGFKWEYIKGE